VKLKAILESLDGLDEPLKALYTKTELGWVLDLEDKDYKSKIDEFRTNNRSLFSENEKLKAEMLKLEPLKSLDPEMYAKGVEALKLQQETQDKKLIDEGKVDELIEQRTGVMKSEHAKQIEAKDSLIKRLQGDYDTAQRRLSDHLIEQRISEAVNLVGKVRTNAMSDVLSRARGTWRVDDSGLALIALDERGEKRFGKEGNPLKEKEWAEMLIDEAPHLFESARGSGAEGGRPNNGGLGTGKIIPKGDPLAFGRNLEAIAKGEAVVR